MVIQKAVPLNRWQSHMDMNLKIKMIYSVSTPESQDENNNKNPRWHRQSTLSIRFWTRSGIATITKSRQASRAPYRQVCLRRCHMGSAQNTQKVFSRIIQHKS